MIRNTFGKNILAILFALVLLAGCGPDKKEVPAHPAPARESVYGPAPPALDYQVAAAYPHNTTSFTQGLLVHKGKLLEGTGSPEELPQTKSVIGVVDLASGKMEQKVELDKQLHFGEGIAVLKDKLYQLTYLSKVGFVYDADTFAKLGEFPLPGAEGWGLTADSTHLILSDGTSRLTFLDPATLKPVKVVGVYDSNGPLDKLNELEYIKGFVYANVYTTNTIVKIDPKSGRVVGKLYLSALAEEAKKHNPEAMEMNGIAYDPATDKVFVTGKLWPRLFEIAFDH